jgi:hypothetical protein
MSAEENKAAFRRIPEEVFNNGNLDLADELFCLRLYRTPAGSSWVA